MDCFRRVLVWFWASDRGDRLQQTEETLSHSSNIESLRRFPTCEKIAVMLFHLAKGIRSDWRLADALFCIPLPMSSQAYTQSLVKDI